MNARMKWSLGAAVLAGVAAVLSPSANPSLFEVTQRAQRLEHLGVDHAGLGEFQRMGT